MKVSNREFWAMNKDFNTVLRNAPGDGALRDVLTLTLTPKECSVTFPKLETKVQFESWLIKFPTNVPEC